MSHKVARGLTPYEFWQRTFLKVYSQDAKKVSLTACHSGRLYLPHTCRSRIAKHSHLYYSVQLNRPKRLTCWTGSGCSNSRKRHPLDKSLTSGQAFWIVIYQVDYNIHPLNKWRGNLFLCKTEVAVYRLPVCKFNIFMVFGCCACLAKT